MGMKNSASNSGKALVLLAAAFLLASPGISEDIGGLENAAVRIIGEAFVKNNGIKTLRVLTDEIGPRLTGSDGYRRAAAFCSRVFSSYGLTNVRLEPFEVNGWLPGPASAEALAPYSRELRIDTLGQSSNTPAGGIIAEVVDVGHGTEEDFARSGTRLKGKIVLAGLNGPTDRGPSTKEWEKVLFAAERGAVACMIISPTKGGVTRTRISSFGPVSPIPAIAIAYEDGLWLRRTTESAGNIRVKMLVRNEILDKAVTENVVAEIKGREKPEEMVILGAHLDTWFLGPGAADNALGVAIVMETARILSDPDLAPQRTIRFVLFSGEEQGMLGSFEYVQAYARELDRIVLMMNLDMAGSMYPRVLSPYGASPIEDAIREALPVLAGLGITHIERRYPFDSDDLNFVARGVPALGIYGNGTRDMSWYHSRADTIDKIDIDKLNLNIAAVATVVHFAASRPEPVGRRVSQAEVIRYFEKENADEDLRKNGLWKRLGFPDNDMK
jgi:Zn-dependent M28 family amino/carboxypeptidase